MSVDGTDFRIQEPMPFWSGWKSFKFNGPGLRYEVGICIQTGHIVWVNGPFAPGPHPDLVVFRLGLKKYLLPGERVEADKGYRGDIKTDTPDDNCPSYAQFKAKENVRDRHETVNRRFKEFNVLKTTFRHEIIKHVWVFHAIVVITQLSIEYGGRPLYQVAYKTAAKDTRERAIKSILKKK